MTTFNPYVVTNVQDGFSVQSQGYWQGDLLDDPAGRYALSAGVVASDETLPMWGGIAVYEKTAGSSTYDAVQGGAAPTIGRFLESMELAGSKIAGFSVFNGSYSLPTTPQSPVPMGSPGNSFNFVRVGTNNRVVVKCSSAVLALVGSEQPAAFSWDVTNQQLIPATMCAPTVNATLLNVSTNGATVSYDAGTGFATWNTTGNVAVIII